MKRIATSVLIAGMKYIPAKALLRALSVIVGLVVAGLVATAQAATFVTGTVNYAGADRNLIYDDNRNLTWLDFTNAPMLWADQMAWAENLSFSLGGVTYDNWHLPSAVDSNGDPLSLPHSGMEDTLSDMGHLYFTELGNSHNQWVNWVGNPGVFPPFNYGPFTNIGNINGYIDPYWLSTDFPSTEIPGLYAYYFDMGGGWLNADIKTGRLSSFKPGIAVFAGNIAVPLPASLPLLMSALGVFGFMGWRRKRMAAA